MSTFREGTGLPIAASTNARRSTMPRLSMIPVSKRGVAPSIDTALVCFACLTKSGPAMKSISACLNSSRELYMDDLPCACVLPVVCTAEIDDPGEHGLPLRVRQPSSKAPFGAFGLEN